MSSITGWSNFVFEKKNEEYLSYLKTISWGVNIILAGIDCWWHTLIIVSDIFHFLFVVIFFAVNEKYI